MQKVDEFGREIERRRFIQLEMKPVTEKTQQVDTQIKKINTNTEKNNQDLNEKIIVNN